MEQLQFAYLTAVAAAAGCIVYKPTIDDGIDALLEYEHVDARGTIQFAQLRLQLKATSQAPSGGTIAARLSRSRFDYYATKGLKGTQRAIVIMHVPTNPAYWVYARDRGLTIHRGAYWVNIAGETARGKKNVTVSAPTKNLFNDVVLCDMMQRIANGGVV